MDLKAILRDLWDNIRRPNIYNWGPRKRHKTICEEIMAKMC